MRWEGFGEENMSNPNYRSQITGYEDNGKAGYLRIAYGCLNYDEAVSPFFWGDWGKDKRFDEQTIKRFLEIVSKFKEINKKEYLDFAELGRELNKAGKKPFIKISY